MLPERLKSLRLETKLTQKEIAEKLGVSQQSYALWENGKRNPKNIQQLADFFSVSTDYLLGNTDEKKSSKFDDLNTVLDSFTSFDGYPLSDEDREAVRELLRGRRENEWLCL